MAWNELISDSGPNSLQDGQQIAQACRLAQLEAKLHCSTLIAVFYVLLPIV